MQTERIQNDLKEIQCYIKEKLSSIMDHKMAIQQQLDEYKDSLLQVNHDISAIHEKKEEEENIFYLNMTKKLNDLDQLEKIENRKDDLNKKIEELHKQINSYNEMMMFLNELNDSIVNIMNKAKVIEKTIKDIDSEKQDLKRSMLEKIKLCQTLVNVDQNRCRIELEELGQFCKE